MRARTLACCLALVAGAVPVGLLLVEPARDARAGHALRAVAPGAPTATRRTTVRLFGKDVTPRATARPSTASAPITAAAARRAAPSAPDQLSLEEAAGVVTAASSNPHGDEDEAESVLLLPRAELVALVATSLQDEDADSRIDALRLIRENGVSEVAGLVARLALDDRDAEVRRFASQVLALGDAAENRAVLERLATDQDLGVRANAAFGLARLGDAAGAARLVAALEEARRTDSELADGIEAALASDELDGSPVIVAARERE